MRAFYQSQLSCARASNPRARWFIHPRRKRRGIKNLFRKVKDTAEIVKGIVEHVPVYQDLVQPAAKELGTALQTVAKTVHIALAPVSALVWGYEQIKEWVQQTVTEKLKDVPPDEIVPPRVAVAGPTIEALRFAAEEPTMRELYANLLATSMSSKKQSKAHPAFVEIIRQLEVIDVHLLNFIYARYIETRKDREEMWSRHSSLSDYPLQSIDFPIYKFQVTEMLKIEESEYMKSVDNLIRLRCITPYVEEGNVETEVDGIYDNKTFTVFHNYDGICMTPFGVGFVEACTNPSKSEYDI
jgi:hypothetical protein